MGGDDPWSPSAAPIRGKSGREDGWRPGTTARSEQDDPFLVEGIKDGIAVGIDGSKGRGIPDLDVMALADDHAFPIESGELPQHRRDRHPALPVGVSVEALASRARRIWRTLRLAEEAALRWLRMRSLKTAWG